MNEQAKLRDQARSTISMAAIRKRDELAIAGDRELAEAMTHELDQMYKRWGWM